MDKFIVCKAIIDSRGTPLYAPIGYVEGLAECIDFNNNNVNNGFIALYSTADNSMGISDYKLSTETIVEDPFYLKTSGRFFDTIKNITSNPIDFCGYTIPSLGTIPFFWNYKISVLCHQELENNFRQGKIRLVDSSGVEPYELTEQEALGRLNAIKTRAMSQKIYTEEDRLLWNIFVGTMVLVKFREYLISKGISNPTIGMSIQQKLSSINQLIQNGQLIEAKAMLAFVEPDEYLTPSTLQRFIGYLSSCYVSNLSEAGIQ